MQAANSDDTIHVVNYHCVSSLLPIKSTLIDKKINIINGFKKLEMHILQAGQQTSFCTLHTVFTFFVYILQVKCLCHLTSLVMLRGGEIGA